MDWHTGSSADDDDYDPDHVGLEEAYDSELPTSEWSPHSGYPRDTIEWPFGVSDYTEENPLPHGEHRVAYVAPYHNPRTQRFFDEGGYQDLGIPTRDIGLIDPWAGTVENPRGRIIHPGHWRGQTGPLAPLGWETRFGRLPAHDLHIRRGGRPLMRQRGRAGRGEWTLTRAARHYHMPGRTTRYIVTVTPRVGRNYFMYQDEMFPEDHVVRPGDVRRYYPRDMRRTGMPRLDEMDHVHEDDDYPEDWRN